MALVRRETENLTVLSTVQREVAQVGQDVKLIGSKLEEEADRAILDWVASNEHGNRHTDNLSRRLAGTDQWLLDLDRFKDWQAEAKRSLFCHGMQGAGKTVLTAVVVDHLYAHKRANKDPCAIGIAFLYCRREDAKSQTHESLLLSILRHFSRGLPSLHQDVRKLHQQHQGAGTRPLVSEILRCLQSTLRMYGRAFIVVDALDECEPRCRSRLLDSLFQLQEDHGVNLFVTTRPHDGIESRFPKDSTLEIKADGTDIRRYLEAGMEELPGFVKNTPELREKIKDDIVAAVCGMFLLAQLFLR